MRLARIRLAVAATLAGALVVGGLAATPAAHATITATSITTPSNPAYFIGDNAASSQNFTVSGTATGATSGDTVDINCYFSTSDLTQSSTVAQNVPVTNGSFSVTTANLGVLEDGLCELRAVPSGTTPSSLTAYAGPTIGVGERDSTPVASGPNVGKIVDYYLYAQQGTAAFDYHSLGAGGVYDGFLSTGLANTTSTFFGNAALFQGTTSVSQPPTRSEVQVDGANAYDPDVAGAGATGINPNGTALPSLTYSYTVDQATGNVVIHEADPLVKCGDATYPPTPASCATYVSTGVTDNRTITQDHDGHIAWVTDRFASTDGKAHSIDLLWDNDQNFGGGNNAGVNSEQIEYEFPGQSAYSMHVAGDDVSLPATGGTIFIRMHGAPDGDTSTGQGAIVYDRPATAAAFTVYDSFDSEFTLHQSGQIPAGGSTRFRFAYVQDYHAANVASMAGLATTAFLNNVSVSKTGKGTVTSAPGGIACGTTCTHGYAYGTSVTLNAKAAKGSKFAGFSGACKGTSCELTVTGKVAVMATFALKPCVVPSVVGKTVKAAKSKIKKALCSVGKVKMVKSSKPKGHVISQSPKHGKKLKQHGKVSLKVSNG